MLMQQEPPPQDALVETMAGPVASQIASGLRRGDLRTTSGSNDGSSRTGNSICGWKCYALQGIGTPEALYALQDAQASRDENPTIQ